jgi:chromosome segregation ATPase
VLCCWKNTFLYSVASQFFQAATLLSKLEHEYNVITDALGTLKLTLAEKEKAVPEFEKKVDQLHKEYETLLKIRKIEEEVKNSKNALVWAFVFEKEQELDVASKEVEKAKASLEKALALVEKDTEIMAHLTNQRNEVWKEAEGLTKAIRQHSEEGHKFEQAVREADKEMRELQKSQAKTKADLATSKNRLRQAETYIQEIKEKMSHDRREEQQKRQSEIEERVEELNGLKSKASPLKEQERRIQEEIENRLGPNIRDLNSDLSRLEAEHRKTRSQIDALGRQKGNATAAFGANVPQILNLIERNQRSFHQNPIGPIGMFVSVEDRRWAAPIETKLRRNLRTFICTDRHDSSLLSDILRRERVNDSEYRLPLSFPFTLPFFFFFFFFLDFLPISSFF